MSRRFGDRLARGLTFWGTVGAVMTALNLKEQHDNYAHLPSDDDALRHGPVALQTANLDEEAADGASLLDTTLPSARPKQQRKTDCCMCCGMRCGLFWKAFGIVVLLFLGYQAVRLAISAAKPSTGLEGMPEFSTSLGCADAQHLYNGTKLDIDIPVGLNKDDHSLDVRGDAVGTIVLVQGSPDLNTIRYELTLRSDDAALFDAVTLDYPSPEDVQDHLRNSRLQLVTPSDLPSSACMRFDATIFLPPALRTLHVQAHALTHIKFDPDSAFALDKLSVSMYTLDPRVLLLPAPGMHARTMNLHLTRGWLAGALTLVDHLSLVTQSGDAALSVRVHPAPSSAQPPAPARLLTSTGAGRADVTWVARAGAGLAHRPIDATHHTSMGGDVYLTYRDAGFNGTVDLAAKAFSTTGLQNASGRDGALPYVGSPEGVDRMLVRAQKWVGLYF
ncbi:hypothetical protein BC628DRAFT_1333796 [Trametes gibbosa]|nr:hypothetical protein BC628DRAFT_1333796 [Trametes gibbosa]